MFAVAMLRSSRRASIQSIVDPKRHALRKGLEEPRLYNLALVFVEAHWSESKRREARLERAEYADERSAVLRLPPRITPDRFPWATSFAGKPESAILTPSVLLRRVVQREWTHKELLVRILHVYAGFVRP